MAHGNEFEFGLDLILDGLERVRDTAQPVPASAVTSRHRKPRARVGQRRAAVDTGACGLVGGGS
jgi:hypothetical protein